MTRTVAASAVPPPRIGTHLRSGGRLDRVPAAAAAIGAEVVQVFVGNPRGWAASAGDPAIDAAYRDAAADLGLETLVHAPYLINLGSPDDRTWELSAAGLRHTMVRARAIGSTGVVVHTGSAILAEHRDAALVRVHRALMPILDGRADDDPGLLLEPTAGQGAGLAATVDDVDEYLDALDRHPAARLCLDTCHAHAAGHDLATPGGPTALLDALVRVAGPGRLAAVHVNDSADVCGAARDRHARIGTGHIGVAAFGELLRHPAVGDLPVVLETPGGPSAYAEDIAVLKTLRDGADRAGETGP